MRPLFADGLGVGDDRVLGGASKGRGGTLHKREARDGGRLRDSGMILIILSHRLMSSNDKWNQQ
jgi:hypothetical protein